MESSSPVSYLLVFDGPASEERISMCVPPTPVRWFCRSKELGSDEQIKWWTMEEPPEDESVEITEYRLNPNQEAREEDGDTVIEYTCDSDLWIRQGQQGARGPLGSAEEQVRVAMEDDPEMARRLAAMGAQMVDPQSIPRSSFAAEDIAAILVNGTWIDIPTPGKMLEVVLEPDGSPVKLSIGANLIYKDNGEYVSIAPQAVQGFRFRPSSVARQPEVTEGIVRIARDTYDAGGAEVLQVVADASAVYVVEPDGEHTQVKDRDGAV